MNAHEDHCATGAYTSNTDVTEDNPVVNIDSDNDFVPINLRNQANTRLLYQMIVIQMMSY